MNVAEDIAATAIKLALAGGVPLLAVLALLLAAAAALVVGRRLGTWKRPPEQPPSPPATWNTAPAAGATVVPNDTPGGCEDPSRCSG